MGWFGITPFGIFGGNRNNNSASQPQQTTRIVNRPTPTNQFARRPIHNAMDWLIRTWQDTASGFNQLLGLNERTSRRNDTRENREASAKMNGIFENLTRTIIRIREQSSYTNALEQYNQQREKYEQQLARYNALPESRRHGPPPTPPTRPAPSNYIHRFYN